MVKNSKKALILSVLEWAFLGILMAVLLLAAVPKILDPGEFAKAILNYRIVLPGIGMGYVYFAASFLPAVELVTAAALPLVRYRRAASLLTMGLMAMFILMVGQAVIRGLNIDCGCFGTGETGLMLAQKVGVEKIFENFALLAMAVFVFRRNGRRMQTENIEAINP